MWWIRLFEGLWLFSLLQRIPNKKLWAAVKPLQSLQPYANPRSNYPGHWSFYSLSCICACHTYTHILACNSLKIWHWFWDQFLYLNDEFTNLAMSDFYSNLIFLPCFDFIMFVNTWADSVLLFSLQFQMNRTVASFMQKYLVDLQR